MSITKTITLYTFNELSDKAKDKARDWWRDLSINDAWYESVYEDAEQVGLKITAFDIDRGNHCDIEFIDGAFNACNLILAQHGHHTDTYKAAQKYNLAMTALPDTGTDDMEAESRNAEAADAIEQEFKLDLENAYLATLRNEYEYINSDEYIDDVLEANEYTFEEDGTRRD